MISLQYMQQTNTSNKQSRVLEKTLTACLFRIMLEIHAISQSPSMLTCSRVCIHRAVSPERLARTDQEARAGGSVLKARHRHQRSTAHLRMHQIPAPRGHSRDTWL